MTSQVKPEVPFKYVSKWLLVSVATLADARQSVQILKIQHRTT